MRQVWIGILVACGLAVVPVSAQRSNSRSDTLTANSTCSTLDVEGLGTGTIELTGTWTATVTFYVEGRAGTQNQVDVAKADTPGTAVNTSTANGIWTVPVAGYKRMSACTTAYTSGSIVVNLLAAGTGGGGGGGGSATASLTLQETADTSIAGSQSADAVVGMTYVWDGTVFRPMSSNTGTVDSGTTRITAASDEVWVANLATIAAALFREDDAHTSLDRGIAALCVRRDTTPASSSGAAADYSTCNVDANGRLYVNATLYNSSGTEITATTALSILRQIDLDESEDEVKASAGELCGIWVTNTATTTRFVKFYNATAANTTVGTTTPIITIGIPGNTSDDVSGALGSGGNACITFSTALSVAATTAIGDADTGAPAANDVAINVFYR